MKTYAIYKTGFSVACVVGLTAVLVCGMMIFHQSQPGVKITDTPADEVSYLTLSDTAERETEIRVYGEHTTGQELIEYEWANFANEWLTFDLSDRAMLSIDAANFDKVGNFIAKSPDELKITFTDEQGTDWSPTAWERVED